MIQRLVVALAAFAMAGCGGGPDAAADEGGAPGTYAPSPPASATAQAGDFDPFAELPYEIELPPDWIGASREEGWAQAVAAFDARNPGALGADDPLRSWPALPFSMSDLFLAFRTDGDVLLVYSGPLGGWTPEQTLTLLEEEPDALAYVFYAGGTPPAESHFTTARLTLPVGPAGTMSGVALPVGGVERSRVAYLIPIDETLYIASFDFRTSQASTRMPQIIAMMQSFRLRDG